MSTDSVLACRRTICRRTPSLLRRAGKKVARNGMNNLLRHLRFPLPQVNWLWSMSTIHWIAFTYLLTVLFTVRGSKQIGPMNVHAGLPAETAVIAGNWSISADQIGVYLTIRVRIELTWIGDRTVHVHVQTLRTLILEVISGWSCDHEVHVLRSPVLRAETAFQRGMVVFACVKLVVSSCKLTVHWIVSIG